MGALRPSDKSEDQLSVTMPSIFTPSAAAGEFWIVATANKGILL